MSEVFKLALTTYWTFMSDHYFWGSVITLSFFVFVYELVKILWIGAPSLTALTARVQRTEQGLAGAQESRAALQADVNRILSDLQTRMMELQKRTTHLESKNGILSGASVSGGAPERLERLMSDED